MLTLGSGNCLKLVAERPQSHFLSLLCTFLFLTFTIDSGFFSSCANLSVWQQLAIRSLFCLLRSLGAEDLANWELNGRKSQAGKFVHEMGILFLWGFATSRYKVSFSLKSTSKHIHKSISYWQGRESRGSRSHVVIARDPGCSLSQACCPWSLDNTVTLHPLATVSITIKTSEKGYGFQSLAPLH